MILVVKALNRSKLTLMPVTAKTKTGQLSPAHRWKSPTPHLAPNGKPSNLNPAQWKKVRTPEFKAWFGDWEIQANNKIVNQKIEEWSNGNLPTSQVIQIGKPGSILSKFGVPNLPIYLTQHILSKATKKKHDVDVADLKDITVNMQAPICIFRSKKGKGSIILVTEKRHRDGNIIVAVELAISHEGLQINDITSIYPKRDESISQWISDGLLWGYEYKNGREWIENSARSNCGQPQTSPAIFKSNIYRVDEIRKVSKVLDENGEPRVVYKGMYPYDWTKEKSGESRAITSIKRTTPFPAFNGDEPGVALAGFFGDKQTANKFSQPMEGYAIYPVFLRMMNPKVIKADGRKAGDVQFGASGLPFREAIRSREYDGVIIENTADEGTIHIALEANHIKSATANSGRFDMNDPDIRKALTWSGYTLQVKAFTDNSKGKKLVMKSIPRTRIFTLEDLRRAYPAVRGE